MDRRKAFLQVAAVASAVVLVGSFVAYRAAPSPSRPTRSRSPNPKQPRPLNKCRLRRSRPCPTKT